MRLLCAVMALLAAMATPRSVCADDLPARGPWQLGDQPLADWRVTHAVQHREFLRYTLRQGERQQVVELVADRQPPGPWTTGRHRLQPGPGATGDTALLTALMPLVRAWDREDRATLQVRAPPPQLTDGLAHAVEALQRHGPTAACDAALLLWALLTLLCWGRWLRAGDLPVLLMVIAGLGVLARWLLDWPLPLAWLHALHESQDIFPAVTAQMAHDGPLPEALRALWPPHPQHWLDLPRAAHAQVFAAAVALGLLALWALRRLPWWAVLALLAGLLAAPPLWRAVLSELPTAWLMLLTWSALAPADLLASQPAVARRWRWLALGQWASVTAALLLTRAELGLGAAAAVALWAWTNRGQLDPWVQRCAAALRRLPLAWLGVATLALLAAGIAGDRLTTRGRWLLGALNPLHRSSWEAPWALLLCLPPAWLLWLAIGARVLGRSPRPLGAAPLLGGLLSLALLKLYLTAAHSAPYEVQRYVSLLAPLAAVAVVHAAAEAWRLREAHGPLVGARRRWPLPLLLASLALPPLPGLAALALPLPADEPPPWQPLDRDRQREARFVLHVAALQPRCALLAKVAGPPGERSFVEHRRWTAAAPQHPAPLQVSEAAGPQAALAQLAPAGVAAPPCVVELRLLDCHRVEGLACAPPPQAQVIAQQRWTSRPYLAPREHGAFVRDIELRAWLWPPRAQR